MSPRFYRTLLAAVALFVLTSNVLAQGTPDTSFRRFSLGPYFLAGASVFSGDVPHTWKTDLKFAYSGGVISTFATSPKFAVNIGLAYDARRIFFFQEADKQVTTQMDISTFDIYTGAKFNDFTIGFDFGFPIGAEMTLDDGTGAKQTATDDHFSTDSLGMKIEIVIGALFNIVESDAGKFQFMIKAAYPLTQMWNSTPYYMRHLNPGGNIVTEFTPVDGNERRFENGVIPSLQFGFVYQFNLGGKY